MDIIKAPLPKICYSPRHMTGVDGAVIHYISAVNIQPTDPFDVEAIRTIFINDGVSAHYLIDRDGLVMELVPLPLTSYHAGYSIMNSRERCNDFAAGIELVGGEHFKYTPEQIASVKHLLAILMTEYGFPVDNIQGHNEVRAAYNRAHPDKPAPVKIDPGENFPWDDVRDTLREVV